ncbi:MAG: tryptophan-rich sensory protein [Anaerolineae bacterium]
MKNDLLRQIINVLAVILTLIVNGLANALPLNGRTTGSISDGFHVLFVPAGYVFAIWGLIYVGLIAFGIYQALPAQRANPRLRKIGYLFALSCLANSAWIFLWHYGYFLLTLVVMLLLLALLIVIYLRLEIGRATVSGIDRWTVQIPFSVYLGWITVATIANVTDVLDFVRWSGWGLGPEGWFIVVILAAVAISAAVSLTRGDIAYLLVIVWAFIGIAVKQANNPLVATTTWVMTGAVVILLLAGVWANRRRPLRVVAG